MSYLDKLKVIHKIRSILRDAFGENEVIFIKNPSFYKLEYGDLVLKFKDEDFKKLIEKLVVKEWKKHRKSLYPDYADTRRSLRSHR